MKTRDNKMPKGVIPTLAAAVSRHLHGNPVIALGDWPWTRIRLAVTQDEYDRLRTWIGKKFNGRLKGVALVIDDTPERNVEVDAWDQEV